jgi:hypothetical protein
VEDAAGISGNEWLIFKNLEARRVGGRQLASLMPDLGIPQVQSSLP